MINVLQHFSEAGRALQVVCLYGSPLVLDFAMPGNGADALDGGVVLDPVPPAVAYPDTVVRLQVSHQHIRLCPEKCRPVENKPAQRKVIDNRLVGQVFRFFSPSVDLWRTEAWA